MKRVLGIMTAVITLTACACAGERQETIREIVTFEKAEDLKKVSGGVLSERHFLSGRKSLQWDYKAGETLTFTMQKPFYVNNADASAEYGNPAVSVIALHLYQEKARPGEKLRVAFGRTGMEKDDCYFEFGLDFTGWRTGWISYSRDMQGTPHPDMTRIRMTAPAGAGSLWIDDLIPCVILDERHQEPDLQVPFVRCAGEHDPAAATGYPWKTAHLKVPEVKEVTPEMTAGFRRIEDRFDEIWLGRNWKKMTSAETEKALKTLESHFAEFQIRRSPEGILTGRPIFFIINPRIYFLVEDGDEIRKDFVSIRQYGPVMLEAARLYRRGSSETAGKRAEEIFLLLVDHLLDQGYVYGSNMGARLIAGYGTREMFGALHLMRDFMTPELRREIFRMGQWHMDLNAMLSPEYYVVPNADQFNIYMRSMLIAVMMLPDGAEKAGWLRAYSDFYNCNAGKPTPGWQGGLKPDGMFFHHWGHYPSYIMGGLDGAATLAYLLSGTPWAATPETLELLSTAVNAMDIYLHCDLPLALHGRSPFRSTGMSIVSSCSRWLGLAGDQAMAALHRRRSGKSADSRLSHIRPDKTPEGFWNFNYGGFAVVRTGKKMVVLKTASHYIWNYETYRTEEGGANCFGRYLSNGFMEILAPGAVSRSEKGWNWNRFPGTTALERPWDVLQAPPERRIHMPTIVDNRVNGSSHLEQKYGAFGSVLWESDPAPRFDPTFRAAKSVFSFDGRLVALGSSIRSESEYPAVTTLMQYPVAGDEPRPVYLNSTDGVRETVTKEFHAPAAFADDMGNGYFVFRGDGVIRAYRGKQHSPDQRDMSDTEGEFATVWLDHGKKPRNAGYEYYMELDLAPEKLTERMAELQKNKPYRVLRCDDAVHAVEDLQHRVTAAIFFQGNQQLTDALQLRSSVPCYVLYRRSGEKQLILSLNTADMAGFIRKGYSDLPPLKQDVAAENADRIVSVTLDGAWEIDGEANGLTAAAENGKTTITGAFRHGIARQITLKQR